MVWKVGVNISEEASASFLRVNVRFRLPDRRLVKTYSPCFLTSLAFKTNQTVEFLYCLLYFEHPAPNSLCAVLLPTSSLSLVAQLIPY